MPLYFECVRADDDTERNLEEYRQEKYRHRSHPEVSVLIVCNNWYDDISNGASFFLNSRGGSKETLLNTPPIFMDVFGHITVQDVDWDGNDYPRFHVTLYHLVTNDTYFRGQDEIRRMVYDARDHVNYEIHDSEPGPTSMSSITISSRYSMS